MKATPDQPLYPYILASNMETALSVALLVAQRNEEPLGGKSAYRAGLEGNLAYLRAHGTLEVRPSP